MMFSIICLSAAAIGAVLLCAYLVVYAIGRVFGAGIRDANRGKNGK